MHQHKKLLQQLNLPDLEYLGQGMQCLVFADGPHLAVKIYETTIGMGNFQRLMDFYHSLVSDQISFQLPEIIDVKEIQGKIIVTEKRLHGACPTRERLSQMPVPSLETYFTHYVNVLFDIQKITTGFLKPAEPLDKSGDFYRYEKYENWRNLLLTNLQHKLNQSGTRYQPFITGYEKLTDQIRKKIQTVNLKEYRLIHGDYFPANTMMNEKFDITAVLDFGTFTILGDPLYDIALGWIFADMYHNVNHFPIKDFVEKLIRERITEDDWQRMKLYILIYSILSADMYGSADVNDGHFRWAMHNLNDNTLREVL